MEGEDKEAFLEEVMTAQRERTIIWAEGMA